VLRARGPLSEEDLARGGAQPSSKADLTQGGAQPSSEADEGAFCPRVRRTSPEGAFCPRARRTSPEGAFSLVALVGRGGHQGRDRGVCVFWLRGLVCVLHFLRN
jgi:hypothetical protein